MVRFLLTLARHLDLVGEHALGYAELIRAEFNVSLRSWMWRLVAFAMAALFLLTGLLSTALVLTMWSNGADVASWRAWIVPVVCLLAALAGTAVGLWLKPPPMSDVLTQQLQQDIDLLRRSGAVPRRQTEAGDE